MSTQEVALVVQKNYEFSIWLIQKVERFPRAHRFSVGDRLVARSLDLREALLEAAYSSAKGPALERAGRHINLLRHLIRMAKDLGLMGVDPYGHASERLEEIGRMAGGWRKAAT